ncbi:LysM peptidoglycan-binding domain-containing protein [bacterium]|nr:LysM peptidoglycan-binding domain-containing protein [bacterium]
MRGILSKPTHYIMHVVVIGLSFFVSVSTVYGDSALYASASGSEKKVTNTIINSKANPRVIASIADVTNAPVSVDEQEFMASDYAYMPSIAVSDNATIDGSFVSVNSSEARNGMSQYTVQGGETLSVIASKFGVTTNTIKWANNLSSADSIKPGQSLTIPPVSGTVHTAQAGDTVSKIASVYNASVPQIMEENGLVDEEITAGQVVIVPGGRKWEPAPQPVAAPKTSLATTKNTKTSTSGKNVAYGSNIAGFPYGQCTYYVASRRRVTWRGNAGAWLRNAAAQGYATGHSPAAGSIVVTSESSVGHVAIVESVSGGYIYVSEMNYGGRRGSVNRNRPIPVGSGVIRGYIY